MNRTMKREKRTQKQKDKNFKEVETVNPEDEALEICLKPEGNINSHQKTHGKTSVAEGKEVIHIGSTWAVYLSKGAQQRIICFSFIVLVTNLILFLYMVFY